MPYLPPGGRHGIAPRTPGELTYVVTMMLNKYLLVHGVTYDVIAEILGSIEGAKADFNRRIVTPYEEKKQAENGDVWLPEIIREVHQ